MSIGGQREHPCGGPWPCPENHLWPSRERENH
jgi:hypothetical protein